MFYGPFDLAGEPEPVERTWQWSGDSGGFTGPPGLAGLGYTSPIANVPGVSSLSGLTNAPGIFEGAKGVAPESITSQLASSSFGRAGGLSQDPSPLGTVDPGLGSDPNLFGGGNPNFDPSQTGAVQMGAQVGIPMPTPVSGGLVPTGTPVPVSGMPPAPPAQPTALPQRAQEGVPQPVSGPVSQGSATGTALPRYGPNQLLLPPSGSFVGDVNGTLEDNPWGFKSFGDLVPNWSGAMGTLPFLTGGPAGQTHRGLPLYQLRGDDMNIGVPDTGNFPLVGALRGWSVPTNHLDPGGVLPTSQRWFSVGTHGGTPGGGVTSWGVDPATGKVNYNVSPGAGMEQLGKMIQDPQQFASLLMQAGATSTPGSDSVSGYASGPFGAFIEAIGGFGGMAGVPGIGTAFNVLSKALTNERFTGTDAASMLPSPVGQLMQLLGKAEGNPLNQIGINNPLAKEFNAYMSENFPMGIMVPGIDKQIPAEMTLGNEKGVFTNLWENIKQGVSRQLPSNVSITPNAEQATAIAKAMGLPALGKALGVDLSGFDLDDETDVTSLTSLMARMPLDQSLGGLLQMSPLAGQLAQTLGLNLDSPTDQMILREMLSVASGERAGKAEFGPEGPIGRTQGNIFAGRDPMKDPLLWGDPRYGQTPDPDFNITPSPFGGNVTGPGIGGGFAT